MGGSREESNRKLENAYALSGILNPIVCQDLSFLEEELTAYKLKFDQS